MNYFQNRLHEVSNYFAHGDTHLGYRRLLDASIETLNFNVYEETLRFCDWYDGINPQEQTKALNEKVQDLLQVIDTGYSSANEKQPALKLKADNISKRYSHGNFSLSSTNVELNTSQIIGLVGENGNGKTTLLRVLHGELQPDSGSITYNVNTTAGSKTDHYSTKAALAFIPQRPQSWYGGLMENLQFAAYFSGYKNNENRLWTEMIVARMGLRPFRTYNWSRISSGYKMRFELARTLIRKPQVLLLDEPLANLDILAQQIILEDLRFLAQSHTTPLSIILSSQQLYEVEKVSDKVIFLQKGVPKYQTTKPADDEKPGLTIELETSASRETLQQVFAGYNIQKLSFNGGVYIIYFGDAVNLPQLLLVIGEARLPVKYLRDISSSSRRFFDA
jgi:ABC-2 type transport system ATP-binding protein